jgi:dTMP kinase
MFHMLPPLMKGLFISFEGTEGCGKSTQIGLLLERLRAAGHRDALALREPGGTSIGEEIRHTLQHSKANAAMTPEAELLLLNASRAQLVRELIRPALAAGRIVLCDRFYDSTVAYQGYGRGLDLALVREIIEFAVGQTRPDLTLYLRTRPDVAAGRLRGRRAAGSGLRDRMEEADRAFFERVASGYEAIATAESGRVKVVDGNAAAATVGEAIWRLVQSRLRTAS